MTDVGGRRSIKTTQLTSGEEGSTWNCDSYPVIGDTWNLAWLVYKVTSCLVASQSPKPSCDRKEQISKNIATAQNCQDITILVIIMKHDHCLGVLKFNCYAGLTMFTFVFMVMGHMNMSIVMLTVNGHWSC